MRTIIDSKDGRIRKKKKARKGKAPDTEGTAGKKRHRGGTDVGTPEPTASDVTQEGKLMARKNVAGKAKRQVTGQTPASQGNR